MFINDLEFINPLSQRDLKNNSAIRGGASAYASAETDINDGAVYSMASATATGDYSRSTSKTSAKLIVKKNRRGKGKRVVGYSKALGYALGKDRYEAPVRKRSRSSSRI